MTNKDFLQELETLVSKLKRDIEKYGVRDCLIVSEPGGYRDAPREEVSWNFNFASDNTSLDTASHNHKKYCIVYSGTFVDFEYADSLPDDFYLEDTEAKSNLNISIEDEIEDTLKEN